MHVQMLIDVLTSFFNTTAANSSIRELLLAYCAYCCRLPSIIALPDYTICNIRQAQHRQMYISKTNANCKIMKQLNIVVVV